jgi:hypothetical protein
LHLQPHQILTRWLLLHQPPPHRVPQLLLQ